MILTLFLSSVSALTGAAEPIYGREAFRSVYEQVEEGQNPYSKLERKDLEWQVPSSSHVETQTFYFSSQSTGHYGFVQIIHSNPVGLHYTAQFTCLVKHDEKPEETVWTSTHLEGHSTKGTDFVAEGLSVTLNEEGTEYSLSSVVNEDSLVEIKISRGDTEGFKIGQDGTSYYGEDLEHPWGSMRHVFWPRACVSGKMVIKEKEIALEAQSTRSMYVMALQGMKPHHAASSWNFLNFQGPTMSCIVMEFTTPPSYGSQTVSIGGVTKDDKLLSTPIDVKVEHLESETDDVGWPAPKKIEFHLNGELIDGTGNIEATVSGKLENLVDRVDVMAEIPHFVKSIVAGVSGAKPYIYQYSNPLTMTLKLPDGKEVTEEGHAFSEATFIS